MIRLKERGANDRCVLTIRTGIEIIEVDPPGWIARADALEQALHRAGRLVFTLGRFPHELWPHLGVLIAAADGKPYSLGAWHTAVDALRDPGGLP
jgi:hypothetical protein